MKGHVLSAPPIGTRYARLTIASEPWSNGKRQVVWAVCECGKPSIAGLGEVMRGAKKSCGCLRGHHDSKRPLAERFWPKVDKGGPDECWPWTGTRHGSGHGRIGAGGRGQSMLQAHRVSWEIHNGAVPDGLCVLHHCDNPPCVNPAHLFIGTQADNLRDMYAKGRIRRKLTDEQIAAIRASHERVVVLAARYGVRRDAISKVRHGHTWRLPMERAVEGR